MEIDTSACEEPVSHRIKCHPTRSETHISEKKRKKCQDMQKIHLMMGGTAIKIFLAVPLPSILQLLLPYVVKEHLSRFPYGPGAEIRKTIYLWRTR